jgi:succinyl-diaminopimelate desuccinylase
MNVMDFQGLVLQYKDSLIEDLTGLLKIESVKSDASEDAPVGEGPKAALDYMMELGERDGFKTEEVDGLAGHIEIGSGDELFGILGHVDVVPPGSGWDHPPFEPLVTEEAITARGVQDDKGPTMAAYYALKILKEQNFDFKVKTRLIIGTDEESDWECTKAYFDSQEMPDAGFAPDAAFPLIYGEKGITSFNIVQKHTHLDEVEPNIELKVMISGERYNMVPEEAEAKLKVIQNMTEVIQSFEDFLRSSKVSGSYEVDNGFLIIRTEGKSAHGSTPEAGVNAGFLLIEFLSTLELDDNATNFVHFAKDYIVGNYDGGPFDMAHTHEEMGSVSVNTGMINYTEVDGASFGVNLRYPEGLDFEGKVGEFKEKISGEGFTIEDLTDEPPHFVDPSDPLVTVLLDSYRHHVEDSAEPFTIGGGTYARTLERGVAFGAMFKDTRDTMHQKNETMKIEELLNATAIYLEAVYRICIEGEISENQLL